MYFQCTVMQFFLMTSLLMADAPEDGKCILLKHVG